MEKGIVPKGKVFPLGNLYAIALARPGDAILVAGKGHEDYQLVGDEVLSFDDRVVAAEELERAFGGACSD